MDSTPTMAFTASYRMAFPAFFDPSVFEATFASTSDMASEASASPAPSVASSRSSFTCKNGSAWPFTSCSALYPL